MLAALDQRVEPELRHHLDSPREWERQHAIDWAAGTGDSAIAVTALTLLATKPDLYVDFNSMRKLADAVPSETAISLASTAPAWLLPHLMRRLAGQGSVASLTQARAWRTAGRADLARLLALAALPAVPAGNPAQGELLDLVLGMRDPDQAADAISRIPSASWDRSLASMLLAYNQERIRQTAMSALVRSYRDADRTPEWVEGLLAELATTSPHPRIRLEAVQALRLELPRRGRETLKNLFPTMMQDTEAPIRAAACMIAAILQQSPGDEPLERLLADAQAAVRHEAVRLLEKIDTTPGPEHLLRLIDDPDKGVRHELFRLIQIRRIIPTPAAASAVLARAKQGLDAEELSAVIMLDPAAGLALAAELCVDEKKSAPVRVRAFAALQAGKYERAAALAQRCLTDADATVRSIARRVAAKPSATQNNGDDQVDPTPDVDDLVQRFNAGDATQRRELFASLQKEPQLTLAPMVLIRLATSNDLSLAREAVQRLPASSQFSIGSNTSACLAALKLLDSPDGTLAAWASKCLASLPYRTWHSQDTRMPLDAEAPADQLIRTLSYQHNPEEAAAITLLLVHPNRAVRFGARKALAQLGYPHPAVADFVIAEMLSQAKPRNMRYFNMPCPLLLQRLPAFASTCSPEDLQAVRACIEKLAIDTNKTYDADGKGWQRFLTQVAIINESKP